MVDFHTHILPQMDDGSSSVEESLEMLKRIADDGIGRVVLTPHYYAERESPEEFLQRRSIAYNRLLQAVEDHSMSNHIPALHIGAEVRYFEGFSNTTALSALKISNSDLLLLEMPFSRWSSRMFFEIQKAKETLDCTIVLAHIERYLKFQKDPDFWNRIMDSGVLIQSNAEFFLCSLWKRRIAFSLFKQGKIDLLGSDCHNTIKRPPCLGRAVDKIKQRLGTESLDEMEVLESNIFH